MQVLFSLFSIFSLIIASLFPSVAAISSVSPLILNKTPPKTLFVSYPAVENTVCLTAFNNVFIFISTHSSDSGRSITGNSVKEIPLISNFDLPHLISVRLFSSLILKTTSSSVGSFEIISSSFLAGNVILPVFITFAGIFISIERSRSVAHSLRRLFSSASINTFDNTG